MTRALTLAGHTLVTCITWSTVMLLSWLWTWVLLFAGWLLSGGINLVVAVIAWARGIERRPAGEPSARTLLLSGWSLAICAGLIVLAPVVALGVHLVAR